MSNTQMPVGSIISSRDAWQVTERQWAMRRLRTLPDQGQRCVRVLNKLLPHNLPEDRHARLDGV